MKIKICKRPNKQISLANCILKTITNKIFLNKKKKKDIIFKLYDTKKEGKKKKKKDIIIK